MKKIEKLEFQKISLEILKGIHNFCIKNDIKYSLGYGTMLGAIRHKGFIPWDDDIDIVMPRPDYNRFVETFVAENLSIISPENNPAFYAPFANVYDVRTILFEKNKKMKGVDIGVKIDIFPLDATPDSEDDYNKLIKKMSFWNRVLAAKTNKLTMYFNQPTKLIKVSLIRLLFIRTSIKTIQKKIKEIATKADFNNTIYLDNIVFNTYIGKRHRKACYNSYVKKEFEDFDFLVAEGYDEILSTIYGDYMTPPPIEKRCSNHNFIAYWK